MLNFIKQIFSGLKTAPLQHDSTAFEHAEANKLYFHTKSPTDSEDEDDQSKDDLTCGDHVKNKSNGFKAGQEVEILNSSNFKDIQCDKMLCRIVSARVNCFVLEIYKPCVNDLYADVDVEYVPCKDDKVLVVLKFSIDLGDMGDETVTIHPVSITPWGFIKQQRCIVRQVNDFGGKLNDNIAFLYDYLTERKKLDVGDIVYADIVESYSMADKYRAIRIQLESEVTNEPVEQPNGVDDSNKSGRDESPQQNNRQEAVTISPDQSIEIPTSVEKLVTFKMRSNVSNQLLVKSILIEASSPVNVHLQHTNLVDGFILPPNVEANLIFCVIGKMPCYRPVTVSINFTKFVIKLSIMVTIISNTDKCVGNDKPPPNAIQSSIKIPRDISGRALASNAFKDSSKSEVVPSGFRFIKNNFAHEFIGRYPVPKNLLNTVNSSANEPTMQDIQKLVPCITEPLSMANYMKRFDALLYLEEIERMNAERQLDMSHACFKPAGEYFALAIENLSERQPSLCVGDTVRAIKIGTTLSGRKSNADNIFEGCICKVLHESILIKFNVGFHQSYRGESYHLKFFFSRFPFRKQHHAVHLAVKRLSESFLFPTKLMMREELQLRASLDKQGGLLVDDCVREWYNPNLNVIQKMAIRNILRGEVLGMPLIVFGPPGTGKTSTLVETALQLVALMPHSNLLIGAPSNSTADLILLRLLASQMLAPESVVRIIAFSYAEKDQIPENLRPYCGMIDLDIKGGSGDVIVQELDLIRKCAPDVISKFRIIVGTCSTLGTMMQMRLARNHFTHVLLDEAGQCSEPQALQVITQCSQECGQVVLFGDPRQLQGVLYNKIANNCGLGVSLLERLIDNPPYRKDRKAATIDLCGYDGRLVTKLLYNYRSHPTILQVFNKLFYEGELRATIDAETSREACALRALQDITPPLGGGPRAHMHGVYFFGMITKNEKSDDSPSWFNPSEARQIFTFTLSLYAKGIPAKDIGVITPYAKQVRFLRNLFGIGEVDMPKIGSVEDFLGQERDIILISTVRANEMVTDKTGTVRSSLGFVHCPKRINVLISRARYLLCVFGNPYTLSRDASWRYYIRYCVKNKAYSGATLPAHLLEEDSDDDEIV